jgi:hypothetical protein
MEADREERKSEMKVMQEKIDSNQKEIKEDVKADQEEMAARLEAKMAAHKKLMTAMEVSHERIISCLEKTRACLECKASTSDGMEPGAQHQKVQKEHAAVKPGRALKKRHGGRHLRAGCRGKPKERTQTMVGTGGS